MLESLLETMLETIGLVVLVLLCVIRPIRQPSKVIIETALSERHLY